MYTTQSLLLATSLLFGSLTTAAPAPSADYTNNAHLIERANVALTPYAPVNAACPKTPLIRPASGLSSGETAYINARKTAADQGLTTYLASGSSSPPSYGNSGLPVVGFTSSGGGYRSLLTTAGVVQGFDIRDSDTGVSGVYQALTYQAGLSGGSWFLSSLAANNWPTITSLKTGLWEASFQAGLLVPANILSTNDDAIYAAVTADLVAKSAAGYNVTVVDPYGRLLSYQLLYGNDGGVKDTLSGLTGLSNFTSHNVPYPIITITTDFPEKNICYPTLDGPMFEFHPYEYGSWDTGIAAFAQTPYMGSSLNNGKPTTANTCTKNYDNIGYVLGTSGDVFNGFSTTCFVPQPDNTTLPGVLAGFAATANTLSEQSVFGVYPNPFYGYKQSKLVKGLKQLTLSDGGETLQNNPIWPFIQPARNVDVLIVNDNSADTTTNYPNGTEIYQTYMRAQAVGLTKMPAIPDVATFVAKGYNKHAAFFGCNDASKVLIVYLPNVGYTTDSGVSTAQLEYTKQQTDALIANGVEVATQNGDKMWPTCLKCAIESRIGGGAATPKGCGACFKKYCYTG